MIKIEVHTLDGALDIEIKKYADEYFLIVLLSKSAYLKQNGSVWNAKTKNTTKIREITNLINECHVNPSTPKRTTINDGKTIKINSRKMGQKSIL